MAGTHAFTSSTTKRPYLEVLNDALLAYIKWKLSSITNATGSEIKVLEDAYYREVTRKKGVFDSRSDMSNDVQVGKQIIPESF